MSFIEPIETPVKEVQAGEFIDTHLGYGEVMEIRRAVHDPNLYSLWVRLYNDPFSTSVVMHGSRTVRNWSR